MLPLREANMAPMSGAEALVPPKTIQLRRRAARRTIDGDAGVRVGDRRDVSFHAAAASVGDAVLPARLGVAEAASAAGAVPNGLGPARAPPGLRLVPPTAIAPGAVAGHCAP